MADKSRPEKDGMHLHRLMRVARAMSVALAVSTALCVVCASSLAGEGPGARSALGREYDETVARLIAARKAIPAGENAADHYARAFEALPSRPAEELDTFLLWPAVRAMPVALRECPGAIDEVRKCREAVTVHLRRGASKKRCMFDLDWRAGPGMLMPHLAKCRDLARRASVYGKLLELEGRSAEAARVYLDIIRMGLHLEQDRTLISVLVGIAVVGIAGPPVEGLLARGPDAETARLVFKGLRDLPRDRFNAARAVDFERVNALWMLRQEMNPAKGKSKVVELLKSLDALEALLGKEDKAGRKPWRIPEDPAEIRREVEEAFETYDRQMKQIARLMRRPYHETGREVADLEKTVMSYWEGQVAEGRFAAALVSGAVGIYSTFQVRTVRGEARLRGLEILAASSLAKAEGGAYPKALAGLARLFPGGVPADPISGKPFRYWLAEGLPAVEGKPDDPKLRETLPEAYHFGLTYRLTLEKDSLARWRAERKRRAAEDAALDEQEGDPDNVW